MQSNPLSLQRSNTPDKVAIGITPEKMVAQKINDYGQRFAFTITIEDIILLVKLVYEMGAALAAAEGTRGAACMWGSALREMNDRAGGTPE